LWRENRSGAWLSSGRAICHAGVDETTTKMQTTSRVREAGGDSGGETADGTEDIWWIVEGKDDPRWWWDATQK
jgi:hypothetical protein